MEESSQGLKARRATAQLAIAEKGRISSPQGRALHLVIQFQMVIQMYTYERC